MRYDVNLRDPSIDWAYIMGVYIRVKALWRTFDYVIPYHLNGGGLLLIQGFFFLAFLSHR